MTRLSISGITGRGRAGGNTRCLRGFRTLSGSRRRLFLISISGRRPYRCIIFGWRGVLSPNEACLACLSLAQTRRRQAEDCAYPQPPLPLHIELPYLVQCPNPRNPSYRRGEERNHRSCSTIVLQQASFVECLAFFLPLIPLTAP